MAIDYTTTALVARIRRAAQLATTNLKLTDAEILQIADECIQSSLWPQLRSCVEDYALSETFVRFGAVSSPFNGPSNPDTGRARIPVRASSSTISTVALTTASGDRMLSRVQSTDSIQFGNAGYSSAGITLPNNLVTGSEPHSYMLLGDYMRILPAPVLGSPVIIRLRYERRPSKLATEASCAKVFGVSRVSDVLTMSATATLPFGVSNVVDIVRSRPQLAMSVADDMFVNTTPSATTFTIIPNSDYSALSSATLAEIASETVSIVNPVYACPNNETCVFPLPEVWWPVCIQESAANCLDECGYASEAAAMREQIAAKTELAIRHSANRARTQPKPIFDQNSPLRITRRRNAAWRQ